MKQLFIACLLLGNTLAFAQPCSDASRALQAQSIQDMPDCHSVAQPAQMASAKTLCEMQSLAEKGLAKTALSLSDMPDVPPAILTPHVVFTALNVPDKAPLSLAQDSIDILAPPVYLATQRFRI